MSNLTSLYVVVCSNNFFILLFWANIQKMKYYRVCDFWIDQNSPSQKLYSKISILLQTFAKRTLFWSVISMRVLNFSSITFFGLLTLPSLLLTAWSVYFVFNISTSLLSFHVWTTIPELLSSAMVSQTLSSFVIHVLRIEFSVAA